MKKSCIFLLVMSIISLLLSVFGAVEFISWLYKYFLYKGYEIAFADNFYFKAHFLFAAIIFLPFFIPGLFGIIGSIKRGRFTVVCIVLGSLLTLYVILESLVHILQGVSISFVSYGLSFVYFALYTAAAAVAFRFRKAG